MAHVAVKLVQGVAVATIHNPPVNGLSLAVRAGLLKALEQARAERADALLLVGGGRTFPAGADIAEFRQPALVAQFPSLNDVLGALDEAELPLVAALHGTALGGGLELALAAHWRVGAPSLRVGRGPSAILARAKAIASAARLSSPASSSTRPISFARGAGTGSPSEVIVAAASTPTTRGRRCVPPAPGSRPSFTSGTPSFADGTATR